MKDETVIQNIQAYSCRFEREHIFIYTQKLHIECTFFKRRFSLRDAYIHFIPFKHIFSGQMFYTVDLLSENFQLSGICYLCNYRNPENT